MSHDDIANIKDKVALWKQKHKTKPPNQHTLKNERESILFQTKSCCNSKYHYKRKRKFEEEERK